MQYIPIKTRVMQPPKDDLFAVLDEYLTDVREGDVVLVSSKIIAIHQGRCVQKDSIDKQDLIRQEADYLAYPEYRTSPLTVTHYTFLGAAGIDESNSDGHYILLPERMFEAAEEIQVYIKERFDLENVGVIVTDSKSQPFRLGAIGVALSFWGIEPLESHIGKEDLFGREMQVERSNIVDALAAGAGLVSGEVAECQPIVIARNVPGLTFIEGNLKDHLMVEPEEDIYRIAYESFTKK